MVRRRSRRGTRRGLLFDLVENDDGNSAIHGVIRMICIPELLIRKASDLRDLIASNTGLLHETPSRVRAIGGQFPIRISVLAGDRP